MISRNRIIAAVDSGDFMHREREMEALAAHTSRSEGSPLVLLAAPQAGSSELLRQTYDKLFLFQASAVPFYFSVKASDGDARRCARRFARELIRQTIAFRRNEAYFQFVEHEPDELALLAADEDTAWIGRLTEQLIDGRATVSLLLNSLLRAALAGVQILPIIDNLHELQLMPDGRKFLSALNGTLSRLQTPSILCGHRRYLFGRTDFESMSIDRLGFDALAELIAGRTDHAGVTISDTCRDLMAVQTGRNLHHVNALIARAHTQNVSLVRFKDFEQLYAQEIFGGSICRDLEALLRRVFPDPATRSNVVMFLGKAFRGESILLEGDTETAFRAALGYLYSQEIVSPEGDAISVAEDYLAMRDYLAAAVALDSDTTRIQVIGSATVNFTQRAVNLMAAFYREAAAVGLNSLLDTCGGAIVPASLVDYAAYSARLKGRGEITPAELSDDEGIQLPNIAFVASGEHFYKPIAEIIEPNRIAVGLAAEDGTAWIAAQIDSKLEADAALAEFWCDRLEMIAVAAGFSAFRLWLIAPEGFDADACAVLNERDAVGSSVRQIELLRHFLSADATGKSIQGEAFELTIPMGEDTELIAAHLLEQTARRHHFIIKSITQMKTALVEACINAAEHSLSPDRKTRIRFFYSDGKVEITVENRGLRLTDKLGASAGRESSERRGWGLKLMASLMDDIRIENTDDGTRLVMAKSATADENAL